LKRIYIVRLLNVIDIRLYSLSKYAQSIVEVVEKKFIRLGSNDKVANH